jgi:hypothetical protein
MFRASCATSARLSPRCAAWPGSRPPPPPACARLPASRGQARPDPGSLAPPVQPVPFPIQPRPAFAPSAGIPLGPGPVFPFLPAFPAGEHPIPAPASCPWVPALLYYTQRAKLEPFSKFLIREGLSVQFPYTVPRSRSGPEESSQMEQAGLITFNIKYLHFNRLLAMNSCFGPGKAPVSRPGTAFPHRAPSFRPGPFPYNPPMQGLFPPSFVPAAGPRPASPPSSPPVSFRPPRARCWFPAATRGC